jgi:sensor histidine kinase YesM
MQHISVATYYVLYDLALCSLSLQLHSIKGTLFDVTLSFLGFPLPSLFHFRSAWSYYSMTRFVVNIVASIKSLPLSLSLYHLTLE